MGNEQVIVSLRTIKNDLATLRIDFLGQRESMNARFDRLDSIQNENADLTKRTFEVSAKAIADAEARRSQKSIGAAKDRGNA